MEQQKPETDVDPGAQPDPADEPAPMEVRDKNAAFKPLVLNREEIDPWSLLESNRGSTRELRRAALELRGRLNRIVDGVDGNFERMRELLVQFAARDQALAEFLARPWYRRWFRAPALPAIVAPLSRPPAKREPPARNEAQAAASPDANTMQPPPSA